MPVFEHDYGIPDEDELAARVGAATPHFAFQIHSRVASFAAALPADHARQAELRGHLDRLERIGMGGESGGVGNADLPARVSLPVLRSE
ncbi:MAG: hypothetical protein RLN63_02240 [Miltoncostaeaceae bacterium]